MTHDERLVYIMHKAKSMEAEKSKADKEVERLVKITRKEGTGRKEITIECSFTIGDSTEERRYKRYDE